MNKLTAEETLIYIIEVLKNYLEELNGIKYSEENGIVYGEKTAYTECLEMVQFWEKARRNGLDFDIEKCYPL